MNSTIEWPIAATPPERDILRWAVPIVWIGPAILFVAGRVPSGAKDPGVDSA